MNINCVLTVITVFTLTHSEAQDKYNWIRTREICLKQYKKVEKKLETKTVTIPYIN